MKTLIFTKYFLPSWNIIFCNFFFDNASQISLVNSDRRVFAPNDTAKSLEEYYSTRFTAEFPLIKVSPLTLRLRAKRLHAEYMSDTNQQLMPNLCFSIIEIAAKSSSNLDIIEEIRLVIDTQFQWCKYLPETLFNYASFHKYMFSIKSHPIVSTPSHTIESPLSS